MTSMPKLFAFFISLICFTAFFKDVVYLAFGKDDFRRAAQSAAETVVLKHMDWAALRVGDPPYLIQEGIEETIKEQVAQNINLKAKSMNVKMISQSTPAYIGLTLNTNYESSILSLTHQSDTLDDVPVRVVEIIESKYTSKNY
ncbi:hypothetical protein QO009_003064 [Brevibacillus aydinogluensis]|uniref:hypothetical protein n=1 Tax=Brevibacillus aydinogluensis TaxID=927786 RepID=UPI002892F34E|nr:hypothetical protein [Brevibacillus aydinogluensis]MDT3417169.1 hypothetical protein [Brevibacillus aydinogluensis]